MNAVLRLNLIVALVFAAVLVFTLYGMIQQAAKDISREVTAGVSFTHQVLNAAVEDEVLLNKLLEDEMRHVVIDVIEGVPTEDATDDLHDDDEVPSWFYQLIPGLDKLEEKRYLRYLDDGRVLQLRADTGDEVEEVWETVQVVLLLFVMGATLSNLAIYFGVRQGIKPVAHFLAALTQIKRGRFTTRLDGSNIREINEIADHFNAMAHELEQAGQENSKLTHELMRIQESERARLARELHDDLGQYLTGIRAQAFLLQQEIATPDVITSVGKQISTNCDAMQTSFKQLIRDLHPVILEQLGLIEAVESMVNTWTTAHGCEVELLVPDQIPTLPDEDQTHIYRIVQESLNNIARHAKASKVWVNLNVADNLLTLDVMDNGLGRSDDSVPGLGLRSMQERARCMNGELVFNQSEACGSVVSLRIPVTTSLNLRRESA